jgi:hypothetical protein
LIESIQKIDQSLRHSGREVRRRLNVDGQSHLKCRERRLQLLDPRGVIDIEQPVDLLLVYPIRRANSAFRIPRERSALYRATLASLVTEPSPTSTAPLRSFPAPGCRGSPFT